MWILILLLLEKNLLKIAWSLRIFSGTCVLSHVCCFSAAWTVALLGSSFHEILQARIQEWVAISSSRGYSPLRNWTRFFFSSGTVSRSFTTEPLGIFGGAPCESGGKSPKCYRIKLICGYVISYSCRVYQKLYGEARHFKKNSSSWLNVFLCCSFFNSNVAESLHTLLLSWKDWVLVEFLLLSLNNWQMKPTWHRRGAGRTGWD